MRRDQLKSTTIHGRLGTKCAERPYVAALAPPLPEQVGGAADIAIVNKCWNRKRLLANKEKETPKNE